MISVVTITYNRETLIKTAIESVLSQTYCDFEYIIVDDGSGDGTKELVERYQDSRIRYIYNEHTACLAVSRNIGIEKARGNIIAFLDSDDYWDPFYLESLDKIYRTEKVTSVINNAFVFNDSEKKAVLNYATLPFLKGKLLELKFSNDAFVIYPSCFSFLRNTNIKFNPTMKYGDNDGFLRVLNLGDSIINLFELVYIKKHDSNMSERKTYDSSFIQAYNEEFQTLDYFRKNRTINSRLYRKTYSRYLHKQADNLLVLNMPSKALAKYLRAFLKYPLHFRSFCKLLLFYKIFSRGH